MKFGQVDNPESVDFSIPPEHADTSRVLTQGAGKGLSVHVGCAKWNRKDLKNFYPRGTKDELGYYSTQFNCIELNATFYRMYTGEQYTKWYEKTPAGFKFFPKLTQDISHFGRLNENVYGAVETFVNAASHLKDKLGSIFLQMHTNFSPKNWHRVVTFVERWPKQFSLAIEFRHKDWFQDEIVANELYALLEENNIANVLVDTAGRRDLMHMRLTNNEAFVRYVGANHKTDYTRLDSWIERLTDWHQQGLRHLHFFIHQNMELESPLLAAHFIKRLNTALNVDLTIPNLPDSETQNDLF